MAWRGERWLCLRDTLATVGTLEEGICSGKCPFGGGGGL